MIESTTLVAIDSFVESQMKIINGNRAVSDKDTAFLFEIDIDLLHRKIKAKISRFPNDFMLRLTKEELQQYNCKLYAFTETGILMIASILKSKRAINIQIQMIKLLIGSKPNIAFDIIHKSVKQSDKRF